MLIAHRAGVLLCVSAAAAGQRLCAGVRQGLGVLLAVAGECRIRWAAIRLTLLVAAISVPLNVVFGLAAAWAIAKFEFRGKVAAHHAD